MKKNVLALSIAAAVAGFGAMGSAHAITTITTAAAFGVAAGTEAVRLSLNPSGVGHMLLVPYFTTQSANVTLLSIVNTDASNGKAVKVRVRGAANSDDLFDFQVFLSPSDVWTAMISKDANGLSQITVPSTETSCMKGLTKGVTTPFSKLRLDKKFPTDAAVAATLNNQTREGYVEIFNMADIATTLWVASNSAFGTVANPVYAGTKHAAGVATCAGLTGLDTDADSWAGLTPPTTGLMGEWLIVNQTTAAAYGGNAAAVQALNSNYAPGFGNVVYWPQTNVVFDKWPSANFTADPLLAGNLSASLGPVVVPAVLPLLQDFPDMSTPYTSAVATGSSAAPAKQAADLTGAIAATAVMNEFLTNKDIGAATDYVVSMPTRRYSVAMNYETLTPAYNRNIEPTYFSEANSQGVGRVVCVWGMTAAAFDMNETPVSTVLPSPQTNTQFCGETTVLGINQSIVAVTGVSTVLSANVAVQGADATYKDGWMKITTNGLNNVANATFPAPDANPLGLPILGGSFTQAVNGASNFGVNADHRATRRIGFQY